MSLKKRSNRAHLGALRKILQMESAANQDELRTALEKQGYEITQSTISRSLRKLGAIKAVDETGQTTYRLPSETPIPSPVKASLHDLVLDMASNSSLIVIHTTPGSASLVARQLDLTRPGGILGTLAGDDTVFIAPKSTQSIQATISAIQESLQQE